MNHDLTRRALLGRGLALAGAAALPAPLRATPAPVAADDPLARLDATAQAALVRRGEASPLDLVDAAIGRIERLDGQINAVVTNLFERARERARGPLPDGAFRGVPYLIKDLDDYAGAPTTHGSRMFADSIAGAHSSFVARTLDTGVVPVGKSNTPEFGLLGTTESILLGVCRNPWDLEHTPGGSSGGAGAAVAAGMVPFAHATDGGGSIRIPASCCGLFGLKPSRGRVNAAGGGRIPELSVDLCVSRSVRDSATLLAATDLAGGARGLPPVGEVTGPSDRRLRIAFVPYDLRGHAPDPEVAIAAERAASLCADLGHEVEPATLPIDGQAFVDHFMLVWAWGPSQLAAQARQAGLDPESVLEPWTLGLARYFVESPEDALARAGTYFRRMTTLMEAFFRRYDVLLTPTLSAPPVPIGTQSPRLDFGELFDRVTSWVTYTPLHNAAGTPAMSVPLAWTQSGLPMGMQFAARRGDEHTLLELAYALEEAQPWTDRWPPVSAVRA